MKRTLLLLFLTGILTGQDTLILKHKGSRLATQTVSCNTGAAAATLVCAFPRANAAGSLLVIGFAFDNSATLTSVTGTNTWTSVNGQAPDAGRHVYEYFAFNAASGTESVTITVGAFTANMAAVLREYSSIQTSPTPFDKNAAAIAASGTALDSGATATLANSHELIIGVGALHATNIGSGSFTPGAGYGNLGFQSAATNYAMLFEDQVVSATTALHATATASLSGDWGMIIGTFICNAGTCPTANH